MTPDSSEISPSLTAPSMTSRRELAYEASRLAYEKERAQRRGAEAEARRAWEESEARRRSAEAQAETVKEAKRGLAQRLFENDEEGFESALSEFLKMEGADLDGSALNLAAACFQEANEDTLVNLCVTDGRLEALKALIAAGANPRGKAKEGEYEPIHHIATLPEAKAIEFAVVFLEAGLSVDSQPPGGVTPLMMAAKANRAEMTAFLLSRGADPEKAGADGLSSEDVARAAESSEALAVLVAWREARELGQSIAHSGQTATEPKAKRWRGV